MKLIFILLAAAGLARGPVDVRINANGGATIEGYELKVSAYEEGWKSLQSKVDWKKIESRPGYFKIARKNKPVFEGEWKWAEEGGKITGQLSLKCIEQISIQSLSFSVNFPASVVGGKPWTASDKKGVFPEEKEEKISYSGLSNEIDLPLQNGNNLKISFDEPTKYSIQDGRRWGDYFSIRFGSLQNLKTFQKGDKAVFNFHISTENGVKLNNFKINTIESGKDWIKIQNHKEIVKGSALDFSGMKLQDGPAGKYGWLKAVGDHFEFEGLPGVPQRFYGINLCFTANFPEHEVSDLLVERLVRLGYNSIRIHHHDNEWSKNEDSRDKLDYLLAKAYEKGLYVTTDLYISRVVEYREIGIDRDGKIDKGDFKRALIPSYEPAFQNWCEYTRSWFSHVNPYTGRAFIDEPGMPLISLINEGKMGGDMNNSFKFESVRQKWAEFSGGKPVPDKNSREAYAFDAWFTKQIGERCIEFVRSLGSKALLTNDNNGPAHAEGEGCTPMYDYVDNHFYVDHPKFIENRWQLPVFCGNVSPVRNGGPQMFRRGYAKNASKPYTITEWNFSGPGRFRGIGGIMTGALSSIQKWDGLWRFAYTHSKDNLVDNPDSRLGYFDCAIDPLMQASDRAAIALFLRGDVKDEEQLSMDKETGVLKLNTPLTCGVFAEAGEVAAGPLKVTGLEKPATVFLTSVDGKPLAESGRMLLTHLTDIQGDGARYADEERHILLSFGKGLLIESGKAKVSLKLGSAASKMHVYAIDTTGKRLEEIRAKKSGGELSFEVNTTTGVIYYELTL